MILNSQHLFDLRFDLAYKKILGLELSSIESRILDIANSIMRLMRNGPERLDKETTDIMKEFREWQKQKAK